MKWRVNWWFHNGRIRRGHDIVEAPKNFTVDDAETMLDREAYSDGKIGVLENFAFWHSKSIAELGFASNFGILSIKIEEGGAFRTHWAETHKEKLNHER